MRENETGTIRAGAKRLPPLGLAVLCAGGLVYMAAVLLAGGALWELALYWLAFAVCILGSGLAVLRLLCPELSGADTLAAAFLPGCALLFGGYAIAAAVGLSGPAVLLPAGLLGGWELWRRVQAGQHKNAAKRLFLADEAQLLLALLGAALALYSLWGLLPFAGTDRLKAWSYNQDMIWSVGNAAAARFGMPMQDLRAAGLVLNYHFFNDLLAGVLAWGTGCTAWHGLCFYWYPPVLALAFLGLYRVARRQGACEVVSALPVAFVYLGNATTSTLAINLYTNANAQGTVMAALGALLLVLDAPCERKPRALAGRFLLGALVFGPACMIKSTIGVLALMALAAAAVVGLFTKQTRPAHGALLLGGLCAFGAAYGLVFSRATNNLEFTTLQNLGRVPGALRGHLALPLLVLYLAGIGYSLFHFRGLQVMQLAINAAAVGGFAAVTLFYHYSASQAYFGLTAVPCAALGMVPLAAWLAEHLPWKRLLMVVGAATLCLCFAGQLWNNRPALRTGVQAALRCAGLRAYEAQEDRMTAEDWDAARWLRENTGERAIFLTNRNNKRAEAAEGVFHYYSAASQRRCYLESYRYAMDYDGAYWEIRRRLEQVSDAIFTALPEEEAFALAQSEGVDYILVSLLAPNRPAWQRQPVYENAYVRIYAVGGAG